MQIDWFEGLPLVFWAAAHSLGILVAFLTQLSLGRRVEASLRGTLAVGIVAVAAIALSTEIAAAIGWVASGATLGLMVIAAVWEPSPQRHDPLLARLLASSDF